MVPAMKTKEQREKEFREELGALLEKHLASIEMQDTSFGHIPNPKIFVFMDSRYDYDEDHLELEYAEFEL